MASNDKKPKKTLLKIIGGIYFLLNLICLAVIILLAMKSVNNIPKEFSPGWVLTLFPLLGMVAGYWLFRGSRFGWFRSLLIVSSVIITLSGVFIFFVIAPEIEKAVSHNHQKKKFVLDQNSQQFFAAIYNDNYERIKILLDQGVDVNVVNHSQDTALHLTNDKNVIKLLLEHGASLNVRNDLGLTPMFGRDLEILKLMIDAGADINSRSSDGNTPLMWYCYSGYLEGIKYLVDLGAKLDTCNRDGNNARYIIDHFQPNTKAFYYVMALDIPACK